MRASRAHSRHVTTALFNWILRISGEETELKKSPVYCLCVVDAHVQHLQPLGGDNLVNRKKVIDTGVFSH